MVLRLVVLRLVVALLYGTGRHFTKTAAEICHPFAGRGPPGGGGRELRTFAFLYQGQSGGLIKPPGSTCEHEHVQLPGILIFLKQKPE